jgi:hyperosmotically inducible periplasmic protein
MMQTRFALAAAAVAVGLLAGCDRSSRDVAPAPAPAPAPTVVTPAERPLDSAGATVDDAAVTTRVKSALIMAPDLQGLSIDVDTTNNVVTLSGTVASDSLREQAEQLTRGVDGVREVRNDLTVRAPT